MSGIRKFDFNTLFTTPTLPAPGTPTLPDDLTPKSYVDGTTLSFALANNQVAAANVTGLVFSSATYQAVHIGVYIKRKTDTAASDLYETGTLYMFYDFADATWRYSFTSVGDDAGIEFSVTAGGQIQYTSTNIAGANYTGTGVFRYGPQTLFGV
jgi:hypothetical protein